MKTHSVMKTVAGGLCLLTLASPMVILAQDETTAPAGATNVAYQAMLEEAERARAEAEQARAEAMKAAEQAREMARQEALRGRKESAQQLDQAKREQQAAVEQKEREKQRQEMERVRDELGRAHRELREASREIAEAHRALAMETQQLAVGRPMNLGDRAVIGVVLGRESEQGVEIIGVSPGGPADLAGLRAGDLLVSIAGKPLGGDSGGQAGRETLFQVMDGAEAGDTLAVQVLRDGKPMDFEVTAELREPSSWQTMIRIPDVPPAPGAPAAPQVMVERIVVPEIDEEALQARLRELEQDLQKERFVFISPDGKELEIADDYALPDDFDPKFAELSEMAGHALAEANVWFGLPQAQGLELAAINEGLGAYFKTDRGVLVIRARQGNAYQLESGDVVLTINEKPVNAPSDLMRALREMEPGSEIEIAIKRDRRNKTLSVVMPENRLGFFEPVHPPATPNP
jgi:C-terminal processing protease CtpA/Prc